MTQPIDMVRMARSILGAGNPFPAGSTHISHSQVSAYLMCPERFRLKYVAGAEPSHRGGDQVLGSAVHGTLAFFHEQLRQGREAPSVATVQECFRETFAREVSAPAPVLWSDDNSANVLLDRGQELLKLYCESCRPVRVSSVEKRFSIQPEDLPSAFRLSHALVGVIDLVEQDADGKFWITELKTAGRKFDDTRLRYDLQVGIYAAARNALGLENAGLRFRLLVKTTRPKVETYNLVRDAVQLREVGRVVTEVSRAIDSGIFYPNRGWACAGCPFRSRCGE